MTKLGMAEAWENSPESRPWLQVIFLGAGDRGRDGGSSPQSQRLGETVYNVSFSS
jgi:hypothetical protein